LPDPLSNIEDRIGFDPPHEYVNAFMQRESWSPDLAAYDPDLWINAIKVGYEAGNPSRNPYDSALRPLDRRQTGVITALAQQYGLCTSWRASVPSSTWPNRFFFHAATCGGCYDGPTTWQMLAQNFDFPLGTVFDSLTKGGRKWKVFYGGGLPPQVFSLKGMRDRWWSDFSHIGHFADELRGGQYDADYTFIEPNYDALFKYKDGNSQHPCASFAAGEALVRYVYESIRSSPYWGKSLLIITYDEHGGFYDHVGVRSDFVPPEDPSQRPYQKDSDTYNHDLAAKLPAGSLNGDASTFDYTVSGFRVPAVIVSPLIKPGTIIHDELEHSCIPATVLRQFGLTTLTARDKAAVPLTEYLEPGAVQSIDPIDPLIFPEYAARSNADYDPPPDTTSLNSAPDAQVRKMALLRLQVANSAMSADQLGDMANQISTATTMGQIQGVLSDLPPLYQLPNGDNSPQHMP
jgi:phospholipase C